MDSGKEVTSSSLSVEAVVVHYGDPEVTEVCLQSLASSGGVRLGMTLVDNGPPGESQRTLEEIWKSVKTRFPDGSDLLRPGGNLGYAGGLNAGMARGRRRREPEFFLFLNNDTSVAPDTVHKLAHLLDGEDQCAATGPAILSSRERDVVWNAGSDIEWPDARPRSRYHRQSLHVLPRSPYPVGYLCGCAILMRGRLLSRFGPLPEDYFLYYEDADLGERIRSAGLLSLVEPNALAWHMGGAASGESSGVAAYFKVRNRILFSHKWRARDLAVRFARARFFVKKLLRGGEQSAGARDGWAGRGGPGPFA